jgi:hypothetical protein
MSTPFDLGYQNPVATVQINTGFVGAAQAQAAAISTAADRVQTGLDRTQTGLDRVATSNDAASTAADRVQTGADRVQTGLDRTQTGSDAASTAADRTAVAADRAQADNDAAATAADRVQTGIDRTTTTNNAAATAADRTQTGLDAASTAADRVQTGLDRTQTGADRFQTGQDIANSSANASLAATSSLTATAQAALAASYAASASSVVQQDLSAINAQALHRSPNAIVAQCIYDVSKDSDGGAWVDRCTQTSWFNEALNGTWLSGPFSGFQSEMDARDWFGIGQSPTTGSLITGDSQTFTNGVGAWTANANGAVTAPNGLLRLTQIGALGTTAQAYLSLSTVANQRYRIDLTSVTPNAANTSLLIGTVNGGGTLASIPLSAAAPKSSKTVSFVASGATTVITIAGNASWAVGSYAEIDNITCTPVSFAANPSGAFYQDATTGKFQRLWKNLLKQSENFADAAWTKYRATPGAVANGFTTFIEDTSAASSHGFFQTSAYSGTPGLVATYSILVKKSATRNFALWVGSNPVNPIDGYRKVFDLTNGVISDTLVNGSGITEVGSTITAYDANTWLVTTTMKVATGTAFGVLNCMTTGTTISTIFYTGDGASSIQVGYPQLELGGAATAYESKAGTSDVGITQVYRGNTAKFPRLAAIVCEATSANIYDLTQPGRPMWKVLLPAGVTTTTTGITGVAAGAGSVVIVGNGTVIACQVWNFVGDRINHKTGQWSQSSTYTPLKNGYLYTASTPSDGGGSIISASINAVAMTVLPDAPVDPFTGLQVPTIAAYTASGVSLIQNNGTVVNSASSNAYAGGTLSDKLLTALNTSSSGFAYAATPGQLGTSFALTSFGGAGPASLGVYGQRQFTAGTRSDFTVRNANEAAIYRLRMNESGPSSSLVSRIDAYSNTGWMVGDIRRCWLSSNVAESITATELVTDSGFDSPGAWTIVGTQLSVTGSQLVLADGGAGGQAAYQLLNVAQGKTVRVTLDVAATAGSPAPQFEFCNDVNGASTGGATFFPVATGLQTIYVTKTGAQSGFRLRFGAATGTSMALNSVSVKEVIADRSYKNQPLTINGTLAKTLIGGIAFYSGWSATNYAQEAYSADLDFGTGAWSVGAWFSAPTALPANSVGPEYVTDGTFQAAGPNVNWNASGGATIPGNGTWSVSNSTATNPNSLQQMPTSGTQLLQVTVTVSAYTAGNVKIRFYNGSGTDTDGALCNSVGTFTQTLRVSSAWDGRIGIFCGAGSTLTLTQVSVKRVMPWIIVQRAAAAGPSWQLALENDGKLSADLNDGTTLRRVLTAAAYNTATAVKARVEYSTSGTLTLKVNGQPVASTTGTPLLTLNNASAVTTIGNARTLDAAFPGSIALVKASATTPTQEQSTFMYEQEKFLFMPGAQCTLPDSGAVVDMDYDPMQDKLKVISGANESAWTGLVCTSTSPASAGSFTKAAHRSGVKLLARSTTNPGVDVTIPAYGLREELFNRAERAASLARLEEVFDWVGGFMANTTGTTNPLTSVSPAVNTWGGSIMPNSSAFLGAQVSGTGIPAGTTLGSAESSNTVIRMSANATANGTGVAIAFNDFIMPVGYEAKSVLVNGVFKQEGSTKDWTRLYDGFRETIRFAVAPGNTAWVQIKARRTK